MKPKLNQYKDMQPDYERQLNLYVSSLFNDIKVYVSELSKENYTWEEIIVDFEKKRRN